MAVAGLTGPISAPKQGAKGIRSAYVCVVPDRFCVGLDAICVCPGAAGAAGGLGRPAGGPQGLALTPRTLRPATGGPCAAVGGRRGATGDCPDDPGDRGGQRGAAVLAAMTDFMRRNRGKRAGCRRANGAPAAPESAPLAARSGRFSGGFACGSYPWTPGPHISSVSCRFPMARWPFCWYRGVCVTPRPNKKGQSR